MVEPAEGWLHFVVPKAATVGLDQSSIRLIADTGSGAVYGELAASSETWNPDNFKRFRRRA